MIVTLVGCLVLFAPSTPKESFDEFLAAWNAKDMRGVAKRVYGGKPDGDFRELTDSLGKQGWPTISYESFEAKEEGDRATVTAKLRLKSEKRPDMVATDTFVMVRQSGEWLLDPPAKDTRLSGIVYTLAEIAAHPGMIPGARRAGIITAAMSNAKQIAVGVLLFLVDSDDKFLLDNATFRKKISPYIGNDSLWNAPDSGKPLGWTFNDRLKGRKTVSLQAPAQTVMFSIGPKGGIKYPFEGRTIVAFADGRVKILKPDEVAKLRWQ